MIVVLPYIGPHTITTNPIAKKLAKMSVLRLESVIRTYNRIPTVRIKYDVLVPEYATPSNINDAPISNKIVLVLEVAPMASTSVSKPAAAMVIPNAAGSDNEENLRNEPSYKKYNPALFGSAHIHTSAKERLNLASNMEGIPNNFKQTLYGQSAIEPEPSQRILIMGLSGLSAFLLSSVVFIFLAYIDQSIKTPSQFNRHTGLNLLGVVNLINMKRTNLKDQVTHIEEEHGKRDNPFRELLRKLRFEIERSNKRIILFTSTEPQQGKTTLVQALAFSLSLGKKKVIILDTNFCNNDLTALNNALPTLEQFSGNGQLDPAKFESLITETGVENVDIIGCKGGDYTPSEILPKNHLLNYLPDILKKYDYVFMEGAPLNGFTDTKELVHYADGVIAIFSATIEVKQSDKESIKFLHELNGKFIGAVLNKVEESDISL